eukprot:6178992-Pleurochrysis_carterae.AAC.1
MAKESVKGGNGGNPRHELERGNAIGVTRVLNRPGRGPARVGEPSLRSWREQSEQVARFAHGGRERFGDSEKRRAVVVRKPRLPPQQL